MPVCRRCFATFDDPSDVPACRAHPGSFAGFEKGKLHGIATSDPAIADLPAVVFLWDCCSALDASAPGCAVAPAHAAYE